jgi:hypothetical protein
VDVMHSLHNSALYSREPITDFEAAVEADARRKGPELIGYREFSDFPQQVQRYFDLFGRENVHTIIFEDLEADCAAVYQNTLHFLGVGLGFVPDFKVMNANASVRNMRLQRTLANSTGVLRQIARALVPQRLRSRIQRPLLNSNLVLRPRAPMDPGFRRRLQMEFEPQVGQLSKLLGRDLSGWCKDLNEKSARTSGRDAGSNRITGGNLHRCFRSSSGCNQI